MSKTICKRVAAALMAVVTILTILPFSAFGATTYVTNRVVGLNSSGGVVRWNYGTYTGYINTSTGLPEGYGVLYYYNDREGKVTTIYDDEVYGICDYIGDNSVYYAYKYEGYFKDGYCNGAGKQYFRSNGNNEAICLDGTFNGKLVAGQTAWTGSLLIFNTKVATGRKIAETDTSSRLEWDFVIYYDANGGTGAPGAQTKYWNTTMYLSNTVPTRTGYDFVGWSTSKNGAVSYYPGSAYSINKLVKFYAVWKEKTYNISYNANGGSGAPAAQTKRYTQNLTLSTTKPTKAGHNFLGWSKSSTATTPSYSAGGSFTENAATTLYAVWSQCSYTGKVTKKATCTEPGERTFTCPCGKSYTEQIPARQHTLSAWQISKTSTCIEQGEITRKCKNTSTEEYEACTHTEKEYLEYAEHKAVFVEEKQPTCMDYGVREHYECTVCGRLFEDEQATVQVGINDLYTSADAEPVIESNPAHKWAEEWTFNGEAQKTHSKKCYYNDRHVITEACTFELTSEQIIDDCVPGKICVYTCKVCGGTYTTVTAGNGHSWGSYVLDKNTTNTHTRVCLNNSAHRQKETCDFEVNSITKATCEADGEIEYVCKVCGRMYSETIPARGHNPGGWKVTTEPSMTQDGKKERSCQNTDETQYYKPCSHKETVKIDKLGNLYTIIIKEMDETGEYKELSNVTSVGKIGDTVTAEYVLKPGFFLDESASTVNGVITKSSQLVLVVYLSRNMHSVVFDNGTTKDTYNLYYGSEIITPEDPEKDGYVFEGWSEDGKNTVDVEKTVPDRNVEYKAVWSLKTYTITYRINGGYLSAANPASYTVESEAIRLNNPTRAGYTFIGWTGSNGTTAKTTVIIPKGSTGNKSYTANWLIKNDIPYTVEHYVMDTDGLYSAVPDKTEKFTGSVIKRINVESLADDELILENAIIFSHASVDGTAATIATIQADGSTVIKIYYERLKNELVLSGTDGIKSLDGAGEYYYGQEVIISADTAEGYEWAGWFNSDDLVSASKQTKIIMPSCSFELTASAKACEYTISFFADDELYSSETYRMGEAVREPIPPCVAGKTFTGWDGVVPATMPAKNLEFHAIFKNMKHKAIFVVPDENGEYTIDGSKFTYFDERLFEEGETVVANMPEVPSKGERYTGRWSDYVLGESDVFIKAVYELKTSDDISETSGDKNVEYKNNIATVTLRAFAQTNEIITENSAQPVDIILVLDTSGSMDYAMGSETYAKNGETTRMSVLKETANRFVDKVDEYSESADHRIAVLGCVWIICWYVIHMCPISF